MRLAAALKVRCAAFSCGRCRVLEPLRLSAAVEILCNAVSGSVEAFDYTMLHATASAGMLCQMFLWSR